jgi:glycosyltransferase involved in cell wall biosynthesis
MYLLNSEATSEIMLEKENLQINALAYLSGPQKRRVAKEILDQAAVVPSLDLSIVVPVYNEEENLKRLYARLNPILEELGLDYEIILIDDGSRDRSYEIMRELHQLDSRVKVIHFRRNFGQTAAFAAGFDYASGRVIITIDADLQNDPADIPKLLEGINKGNDIVSGWRYKRQDGFWLRRFPSKLANWLISKVTDVQLHDYGCSLKAYRSDVVKNINLYGELHRFIPALASSVGAKVLELPVNHFPRQYGTSKYGISRTVRVILDLLTVRFMLSYSVRPMQFFGLAGFLGIILGSGIGVYLTGVKLLLDQNIGDRPLLLLAILLVVVGIQLLTMGLLGEMVMRAYYETQNKSIYHIREILD